MPQRLDWQRAEKRREIVRQTVDALSSGALVVFPTETVYGIAALARDSAAVGQLVVAKGRPAAKPFTMALAAGGWLEQFVEPLPVIGRRIAERCWPGPVTLVLPLSQTSHGFTALPESVRRCVSDSTSIGLRVPDHPSILEVLRALATPLVLTSANRSGGADPLDADAAIAEVGEHAALVIDDGPTQFGQPSTVVLIRDGKLAVLREGVVAAMRVKRMAAEVITFVCTGNSCRSPMAEAIFKRMIADKLQCDIAELPERGFVVLSAGLAAYDGAAASIGARETVLDYNASLDDHVAQNLTDELVQFSDRLIVMTREHKRSVEEMWPGMGPPPVLLCGSEDLPDPVGGPIEEYRSCAAQIAAHLRPMLSEIVGVEGI